MTEDKSKVQGHKQRKKRCNFGLWTRDIGLVEGSTTDFGLWTRDLGLAHPLFTEVSEGGGGIERRQLNFFDEESSGEGKENK